MALNFIENHDICPNHSLWLRIFFLFLTVSETYRVKEVLDFYQALVDKDFKVWIDRKEGINSNMNKE